MVLSFISRIIQSIFSFQFSFHKKTSERIIDPKVIGKGETKIEKVWSWKRMKNEKFAITRMNGKVEIKKLE